MSTADLSLDWKKIVFESMINPCPNQNIHVSSSINGIIELGEDDIFVYGTFSGNSGVAGAGYLALHLNSQNGNLVQDHSVSHIENGVSMGTSAYLDDGEYLTVLLTNQKIQERAFPSVITYQFSGTQLTPISQGGIDLFPNPNDGYTEDMIGQKLLKHEGAAGLFTLVGMVVTHTDEDIVKPTYSFAQTISIDYNTSLENNISLIDDLYQFPLTSIYDEYINKGEDFSLASWLHRYTPEAATVLPNGGSFAIIAPAPFSSRNYTNITQHLIVDELQNPLKQMACTTLIPTVTRAPNISNPTICYELMNYEGQPGDLIYYDPQHSYNLQGNAYETVCDENTTFPFIKKRKKNLEGSISITKVTQTNVLLNTVQEEIDNIIIYNALGSEQIKSSSNFQNINIEGLSTGIYFLQVIKVAGDTENLKFYKP